MHTHALRGLVYRLMAALYLSEPNPVWLGSLAADGIFAEFPVPLESPHLTRGAGLLQDACTRLGASGPDGEYADALREEYRRLFVGPGRLPAPPWESVYRSRERLTFDWPTLQVRSEYRAMGLAPVRDTEPDDHIGLELFFLAILSDRSAAGEPGAAEAREAFLQRHLLQWTPAFARDLAQHAQTELYQGLALLTIGLSDMEQNG